MNNYNQRNSINNIPYPLQHQFSNHNEFFGEISNGPNGPYDHSGVYRKTLQIGDEVVWVPLNKTRKEIMNSMNIGKVLIAKFTYGFNLTEEALVAFTDWVPDSKIVIQNGKQVYTLSVPVCELETLKDFIDAESKNHNTVVQSNQTNYTGVLGFETFLKDSELQPLAPPPPVTPIAPPKVQYLFRLCELPLQNKETILHPKISPGSAIFKTDDIRTLWGTVKCIFKLYGTLCIGVEFDSDVLPLLKHNERCEATAYDCRKRLVIALEYTDENTWNSDFKVYNTESRLIGFTELINYTEPQLPVYHLKHEYKETILNSNKGVPVNSPNDRHQPTPQLINQPAAGKVFSRTSSWETFEPMEDKISIEAPIYKPELLSDLPPPPSSPNPKMQRQSSQRQTISKVEESTFNKLQSELKTKLQLKRERNKTMDCSRHKTESETLTVLEKEQMHDDSSLGKSQTPNPFYGNYGNYGNSKRPESNFISQLNATLKQTKYESTNQIKQNSDKFQTENCEINLPSKGVTLKRSQSIAPPLIAPKPNGYKKGNPFYLQTSNSFTNGGAKSANHASFSLCKPPTSIKPNHLLRQKRLQSNESKDAPYFAAPSDNTELVNDANLEELPPPPSEWLTSEPTQENDEQLKTEANQKEPLNYDTDDKPSDPKHLQTSDNPMSQLMLEIRHGKTLKKSTSTSKDISATLETPTLLHALRMRRFDINADGSDCSDEEPDDSADVWAD